MTPGLLVSGLAAAFLVTGSIAAQVPGPRQRRGLEEVIVTAQGRLTGCRTASRSRGPWPAAPII